MLLISFVQVLPWILGGLFIVTIVLSLKGILSPIFTIILLFLFGGSSFFFTPKHTSFNKENPIIKIDNDNPTELTKNNHPLAESKIEFESNTSNPKEEITSPKNTTSEIKNIPIDNNLTPKEYEITDKRLWTYKTSGYWKWDKSFLDYFKNRTGWKKEKKGNYEIAVDCIGNFAQKIDDNERLYVYSGGEIEIRVNGKLCCCENIVSIPAGISHSQLVKAKEKLQDKISHLLLENKEKVVAQLQKCL